MKREDRKSSPNPPPPAVSLLPVPRQPVLPPPHPWLTRFGVSKESCQYPGSTCASVYKMATDKALHNSRAQSHCLKPLCATAQSYSQPDPVHVNPTEFDETYLKVSVPRDRVAPLSNFT